MITASSADVNLCKTIVSALVAGYPTPTIINWGRTFDENDSKKSNQHVARITGVHDYLQSLDQSHDEDLVLVVDGYDIWFQLNPQVLIDRYHNTCKQAIERVYARLGIHAVEELKIDQNIVFGAQKVCWPGSDDDLNCYAVPNSTLPESIYGADTDTTINDPKHPFVRFRPRYLSSGVVMGPVKNMQRFYERAMSIYNENPKLVSDQSIFARIYGEQEYQREVIRLRYSSWGRNWKTWISEAVLGVREMSILDPHPARRKMLPADGASLDFGVTLDYASLLGQGTVYAEKDSDWILFNDTKTIAQAYSRMEIVNPGAAEVNRDVRNSLPPFWTTSRLDVSLPIDAPWSGVMLYTNLYTGVIPAIIHHNAYRDNLKALREGVWERMWFQPHIRDMLRARLHEPYLPIAFSGPKGREKLWWGPTEKRSLGLGVQPDNTTLLDWLQWEDFVDEEWNEEIFRDGLGPWKEVE